jgi:hypothetical protein
MAVLVLRAAKTPTGEVDVRPLLIQRRLLVLGEKRMVEPALKGLPKASRRTSTAEPMERSTAVCGRVE